MREIMAGGWGGPKGRGKPVIARCEIKMGAFLSLRAGEKHGEILVIPPLPVFVVAETLRSTGTCLHWISLRKVTQTFIHRQNHVVINSHLIMNEMSFLEWQSIRNVKYQHISVK